MPEATCRAQSSREAALAWTALAFFGGFAGVSAFGPIVAELKKSMDNGAVLMGILAASPALTGSLLRIPFGAMVDKSGGKKPILILLGLAALGLVGIIVTFGLAPAPTAAHYPLFLLFGMLCGCGIAVFSVGIPTVSYWYPQKRQGTALAVYAGLGNLAPGVFALLLPLLVTTIGFGWSYTVWLGLLSAVIVLIYFFMMDAPYFQYRRMGLEIDPDALLHACGEELLPSGNATASLKEAAGDWRTWFLTFFYFVSFGGFIAMTVWLPTYWRESFGTTLVRAGQLAALYSISTSLLRVLGGWVSDRFGGERVVLVSFILTGLGGWLMTGAAGRPGLAVTGQMVMALGMGFANAAVFKLVPLYSPKAVGGVSGIVGGLGAFGGFAIPPLMGLLVRDSAGLGYARGFWIFVGLAGASLVLFGLLKKYAPKPADLVRTSGG
jgi:NNP family nitrate/nitrite transporter-like MFS transporter